MTDPGAWVVLYGCGHWKIEQGRPIRETTPRVCSERHAQSGIGLSPQRLSMQQAAYVDLDAVRSDPEEFWPPDCTPHAVPHLRDYVDILRAAKDGAS